MGDVLTNEDTLLVGAVKQQRAVWSSSVYW